MKKISRTEAIKQGLKKYYTGKPCRNGHVAERNVYQRRCVLCKRDNGIKDRCRRPSEVREQKRKWYLANIDHVLEKTTAYTKAHPEQRLETARAYSVRRRARVLEAQPHWVDEGEIRQILSYAVALGVVTGKSYEVHHIQPLVELKDRCGLHVPWNLEVLSKRDHIEAHRRLRDET